MQQQQTQLADPSKNNIIVGPDYGQMIRSHTNGAILEAFISMLFSKDTTFNIPTILILIRNMAILMGIKAMLEDSKSYLDNFKFTNLNIFRYFYQYLWYSEVRYQLVLVGGKWMYNKSNISTNTLTPFLEFKSISISQPGTYYFDCRSFLIKVTITPNLITFAGPKINSVIEYINTDIIHKNKEILIGGKTTMSRMVSTSSNILKIEPMQLAYAFPTKNYLELKESINNYFLMDSILKNSSTPFCVSFDGEPGTGKTTFGSYIASSGIFDRIVVCNLVQATNTSFQDFVVNLERQITNSSSKDKKQDSDLESILLILDELDKWFESYVSLQIHKLREDARGKKQTKDDKSQSLIVESYEKLTPEEEAEKRSQIRNEFLDQLYKLVDGHILTDTRKYVIIFNTNHFDKLFSNTDERYGALLDRFQRYKFNKIGKSEIISYLQCIIVELQKKLAENENNPKIENRKLTIASLCKYNAEIFDQIPDTISITYRALHKVLRTVCFKIDAAIQILATSKNFESVSL